MTCREFVEVLMAYLDGELAPEERSVFEEHIGACPPCLTYLDTYKEAVALGKSLCEDPEGPVPGDAPEELVAAVLAARRARG